MSTVVLKSVFKKGVISAALMVPIVLAPSAVYADKTDDILNRGIQRQKAGAASQKRIDDISERTETVIGEYHQQRKNVEVLKKFK